MKENPSAQSDASGSIQKIEKVFKTESQEKSPDKKRVKSYHSLSLRLVLWFLLLSLIPLILVSSLSYQRASSTLVTSAKTELTHSSQLTIRFINNWFDYRFSDLGLQADSVGNALLLQSLIQGLEESGLPAAQYVNSDSWTNRASGLQEGLMSLSRRYDYIADLYLIDPKGNILFSMTQGPDFGKNIFAPPIRYTRFASTVKRTLKSGEVLFSDLERYPSPGSPLAGFLTTPLLDLQGNPLGALAIRLSLDRIFDVLKSGRIENSSITHYLLAENGILRTPIENNWDDVLHRKIDTEQYQHFLDSNIQHKMIAEDYLGPDGDRVIGTHSVIHIANVDWILVSEIDRSEALASAHWLGKVTLILVLITAVVVFLLAFVVARRITRPIIQLADASKAVAAGETNQRVAVKARDEIGQLADAFNHMLEVKLIQQQALEASRLRSEEALEDLAEQQFALDQHAIVAITNVQGTITYANDKFVEISGYNKEELVGENHRILNSGHHPTDFFKEMYRTIAQGGVWHGEICNKAKSGQLYWVDTTVVPFKGEDGKPESYIAIRTDITQRKQVEQAMSEAKEQAEQAAKAKSEFLASMSHEIRTPMNGVLGMLSLLQNSPLNDDQKHKTRIAQSSAQSLLTLINDILDFSKVDAGKLELEKLDFDLRDMLADFCDSVALQTQEKELELILDLTQIEDSGVRGDPTRIRQILTNLVGNAIKFTEQGEIVIQASLRPASSNLMRLDCSVTDTGIGIPKSKLDHLFDSFSQVDSSTTRKYGGTGLGLAICKKLCGLMDGEIWVHSQPDKGSSFSFYAILEKGQLTGQKLPQIDFHNHHLLIVDGSSTHREVLSRQLKHWGAEVTEAANGRDALMLCKQRATQDLPIFDAAFIDRQSPEINGQDLAVILKADQRFAPMSLIMMSAFAEREDNQTLHKLGFSTCFKKPATTSDVMNALISALNKQNLSNQAIESHTALDANTITNQNSAEGTGKYRTKGENRTSRSNAQTAQPLEATSADITHSIKWPTSYKVLLVEDNQVNQMVASGILAEFGLSTDIANNGQEALNILQTTPDAYQLVLMDCQMPVMDGYVATQKIRNSAPTEGYGDITIIAMTANAMAGDREKCLAVGMDDYLSKPIAPEELLDLLQHWLPISTEKTDTGISAPSTSTPAASTSATSTLTTSTPAISTPAAYTPDLSDSQIDNNAETDLQRSSKIPVWDSEAALHRIMNQQELLYALIDAFQLDLPPLLQQLRTAVDHKDYSQVKFNAHTLKGLAGNLSATELQHYAMALEKSALEQSTLEKSDLKQSAQHDAYDEASQSTSSINTQAEMLDEQMTELEQSAERLQQQLRNFRQQPESEKNSTTNLLELSELLSGLYTKLESGEYIDPDEVSSLQNLGVEQALQQELDLLAQQINQFDFAAAMDTLKKIDTNDTLPCVISR